MNLIFERLTLSKNARFSSPGTPKIYSIPSATRVSTKMSAALVIFNDSLACWRVCRVYNDGKPMKETLKRNGSWLFIIIFVLFANLFLFHSFGALAAALLMLGICVLEIMMFRTKTNALFGRAYLLSTAILSITVLYVSSPEKYALIALTYVGTMIIAGYSMLKSRWISGILELILSPVMMAFSYLSGGINLFLEMASGNFHKVFGISDKDKGKSAWLKSCLIGVIIGIPLVIWLTSTLSQADPIFASYTKGFLTHDFWNNWMPRAIFSLVIFLAITPLVFMRLGSYISPLSHLRKVSWSREVVVVTGMVVLVLAAFLAIQWPYVFVSVAKETDLSSYGVPTYSAYVQRGFWDLLKVAGMVFGIAWAGLVFGKNSVGLTRKIYFGLQTILGLEFVIFIASIFRRVWLYQSYHGLSLARLYGLVVLIWIIGMVVTMAMRYSATKIAWVRVEMGWLLIVIMTTIFINLENLVVKDPPTVNGRVDYVYLSRLPGDGSLGWVEAYKWANITQLKVSAQSGVISKENRRDAYYAWYIAGKLASNYHKLISQYGTDEELREYYRQVTRAKLETLPDNMLLDTDKPIVKDTLDKVLVSLDGNDWAKKVSIGPSYGHMLYRQGSIEFGTRMDTSIYIVSDNEGIGRPSRFDSFLSWSGADVNTYQLMKKDIGTQGILALQSQNITIMKRILSQSKSERDIDVDISFDSPFMR